MESQGQTLSVRSAHALQLIMSELTRGNIQVDAIPFFLQGKVIKGFGRGSKELGIPTANIPIEPYSELLQKIPTGVYYGWAAVFSKNPQVLPMAMNIGWNPYYKNTEKSIEIHIIHQFSEDFYGEEIRAIVLGYIRPEADFKSLDSLIQAIKDDITYSQERLAKEEAKKYVTDPFFTLQKNSS